MLLFQPPAARYPTVLLAPVIVVVPEIVCNTPLTKSFKEVADITTAKCVQVFNGITVVELVAVCTDPL